MAKTKAKPGGSKKQIEKDAYDIKVRAHILSAGPMKGELRGKPGAKKPSAGTKTIVRRGDRAVLETTAIKRKPETKPQTKRASPKSTKRHPDSLFQPDK